MVSREQAEDSWWEGLQRISRHLRGETSSLEVKWGLTVQGHSCPEDLKKERKREHKESLCLHFEFHGPLRASRVPGLYIKVVESH